MMHYMTTDDYKRRVIALFQSGQATAAAWQELGHALLLVSESEQAYEVEEIDRLVGVDKEDDHAIP